MDQAILRTEALRLPPGERALLADTLLASLDDDRLREIEAAWAEESEDRLDAFHRGDIAAVDGLQAIKDLRHSLSK